MKHDTVTQGLRSYRIGEKVRELRLRKKLGLVELGKHTGLSPGLLSKIESSKIFPPLGTLLRIALVFDVGLDYFFTERETKKVVAVVRKGERLRFPDQPGKKKPAYVFESLDFPATERVSSSFFAEFSASEPAGAAEHEHPGFETIYVISGRLGVTVDDEEHVLSAGDSIYFDASGPHAYRRIGATPCRAVVLTVPG